MSGPYRLVVYGAPRTKKTHNQVVRVRGKPVVMPSPQWRKWAKGCLIAAVRGELYPLTPITATVNCRALFYRDRRVGDAVGYYQGLADLLEQRAILADDRLIVSWDGSRLLVDRERPRIELELRLVGAQHELIEP